MTVEAGSGEPRGIGARLRAAREKRGLTLLQAAERLHLDVRVVEALEAGDFAALGADVYVRGHLRRYAEAAFQLANLQFELHELAPARAGIDAFIGTYEATPDLLLLGVRVARAQGDRLGAQRYARKLQLDFPGTDQARALAALDHNPG